MLCSSGLNGKPTFGFSAKLALCQPIKRRRPFFLFHVSSLTQGPDESLTDELRVKWWVGMGQTLWPRVEFSGSGARWQKLLCQQHYQAKNRWQ